MRLFFSPPISFGAAPITKVIAKEFRIARREFRPPRDVRNRRTDAFAASPLSGRPFGADLERRFGSTAVTGDWASILAEPVGAEGRGVDERRFARHHLGQKPPRDRPEGEAEVVVAEVEP